LSFIVWCITSKGAYSWSIEKSRKEDRHSIKKLLKICEVIFSGAADYNVELHKEIQSNV
jgi:hypothetical protein